MTRVSSKADGLAGGEASTVRVAVGLSTPSFFAMPARLIHGARASNRAKRALGHGASRREEDAAPGPAVEVPRAPSRRAASLSRGPDTPPPALRVDGHYAGTFAA